MTVALSIVREPITRSVLAEAIHPGFDNMVKAVVDVSRRIMSIGGEMHADEEATLLGDGSEQASLWGINLYLEARGTEAIEYDSLINIRPSANNRTRGVENAELRTTIQRIVAELVPDL